MAQGKKQANIKKIENILKTVCETNLDDEYRKLSFRILKEISENKKLGSSLSRSKPESWAAGILTVLGRINYLSDPNFEPCMTLEQLAKTCGVSVATGAVKADLISDELGIGRGLAGFDYQLPSLRDRFADVFSSPLEIIHEFRDAFCEMFNVTPEEIPQILVKLMNGEPELSENVSPGNLPRATHMSGNIRDDQIDEYDEYIVHSETIYQIKISLKDFQPTIWRRIQTPDMPLSFLNHAIQLAMGWYGGHLHHFEIDHEYFGDPTMLDDVDDEGEINLSDLVSLGMKQKKFIYLYDFGDSWEHEIIIEKQFESTEDWAHPRCIAGENACPPEDCGGLWGYAEMLEARNDPNSEEVTDFFYLDEFDPKEFDVEEVNRRLTQLKRTPYPPE